MDYNFQPSSFHFAQISPGTNANQCCKPENPMSSDTDSLFATLTLNDAMDTDALADSVEGGEDPDGKEDCVDPWLFAGVQVSKWELPDTEEGLKEWLISGDEIKQEIVTIKKGKRVKWKAGAWVEESLEQRRKERKKRRDTLKRNRVEKRYDLRKQKKPLPSEKW